MFFSKDWTGDANNSTTIGLGWNYVTKSGTYFTVSNGAVAPTTTDTYLARRTMAAAVGGEVYAETTITAADATSEVFVGVATDSSSTDLLSAALYARYSGSNTRFQILRKLTNNTSLAAVGSTVTRALVVGDVMRLTIHGTTATLSVNGTVIITSSVSGNTDLANYSYPALRLKGSAAIRVTTFKSADYGVETDPGGGNVLSEITGGNFLLKSGAALLPLNYIGMKISGSIVQQNLNLLATAPPVYPSDVGYGPDVTMTNAPTLPGTFTPLRTVNVSNAPQLQAAITAALPGDLIEMAAGLYNDKFELINLHGTSTNPIVIRGPKEAIMQLGDGPQPDTSIDYGSGYALAVDQCSYIWLVGFSVQYGPKGIVSDESNDCWYKGLTISWVEQEAFHLRNYSNRNIVEDCIVHDTGKKSAGFGEAYYIGSANSNWAAPSSRTGGNPDTCLDNVIRRCSAYAFTGEGVDVKEASNNNLIEYCWFDGSSLNDDNSADTWIDVKGNNNTVQYNYGRKTFNGAYSVYNAVPGSGLNNVFRGNVGDTRRVDGSKSPDVSINIKTPGGGGNIVYTNNSFVGSAAALSNITTTAP